MNVKQRITKERKSTALGILLIAIALADKWFFGAFTSEIMNVSIQSWAIGAGVLLILMKDTIKNWIERKLK